MRAGQRSHSHEKSAAFARRLFGKVPIQGQINNKTCTKFPPARRNLAYSLSAYSFKQNGMTVVECRRNS